MFESLLHSNLTRKQFLLVIFSLFAGLVGIKHLLQQASSSRQSISSGFSSGPYGR